MKTAVKKIVAVLCCVLLLGAAITPSVFALGFFDNLGDILGDDFDGILDGIFGGNNNNSSFNLSDLLSNPGGILDSLRERLASLGINVSNNAIAGAIASILTNEDGFDISSLLGSSDLLNRLVAYFSGNESTTAEPSTEESTTEESTTEEPSTEETTTAPQQPTSAPTTQPFTNTTAPEPSSEPSYSYVEPSVQYTDPLTTVPFAPVYEEDYSKPQKGVTGKMIAGIAILIVSAVAVVGVVVALKKTKV